ncbi:MAG: UDP-glucose 4-epimerase GalE [Burkholderiaceae bacterium]|nr:UDP-glucose 4-epimerase GalE [Burkholderiaceae bacterium]
MTKTQRQPVLVTGGAGYIGSHTVLELLLAGYPVVVLDNLSNASPEALVRVERITGARAPLVVGDIRDEALVTDLLARHDFGAVLHFAGLKAVGESVAKPLAYYDNNVTGTQVLLRCLQRTAVRRFVFSSSATVYGDPESVPLSETSRTGPTNPYGRSKWMIEFMLGDLAAAEPGWAIGILRYFNPVGAHSSGLIGEDPADVPNNLMPFVAQVAVGRRERLSVFGSDWPTEDGTGVRDYIHVVDLAQGHVAALERLNRQAGAFTVNLGTGRGYSVLQMIRAFEKASGRKVPYDLVARRPGDIAECWADPAMAHALLGWRATRDIDTMCADVWRWQSGNPLGYRQPDAVA